MRSNPKKYKQTKYYKTLNVVSKEYYKILMLLKKYEAKLCKKIYYDSTKYQFQNIK